MILYETLGVNCNDPIYKLTRPECRGTVSSYQTLFDQYQSLLKKQNPNQNVQQQNITTEQNIQDAEPAPFNFNDLVGKYGIYALLALLAYYYFLKK